MGHLTPNFHIPHIPHTLNALLPCHYTPSHLNSLLVAKKSFKFMFHTLLSPHLSLLCVFLSFYLNSWYARQRKCVVISSWSQCAAVLRAQHYASMHVSSRDHGKGLYWGPEGLWVNKRPSLNVHHQKSMKSLGKGFFFLCRSRTKNAFIFHLSISLPFCKSLMKSIWSFM